MYLDSDWAQVRRFILRILQQKLLKIRSDTDFRDPKTRLQELLQQHKQALPTYQVVATSGQDHCKEFEVICRIDNDYNFTGLGRSRRLAEQQAAEQALQFYKSVVVEELDL